VAAGGAEVEVDEPLTGFAEEAEGENPQEVNPITSMSMRKSLALNATTAYFI
jgi:hypothetical protein